jgi:uncharacterized membrane protein
MGWVSGLALGLIIFVILSQAIVYTYRKVRGAK